MRKNLKRIVRALARPIASSRAHAKLVTWMAQTGVGTDECLRQGSLPLPVHYYSPVPDLDDLASRGVWDRKSNLAGVEFRSEVQVAYLLELGNRYGGECAWPAQPANRDGFYTENGSFSFGCAAAAHCVVRDRKPRRIVEIGSGNSSLILSAALALNQLDGAPPAEYTIVDPYPSGLLGALPGAMATVIAERVELLSSRIFDELESGDILFVDSGHVARIGGDVNYLVLDILPLLSPGVVVHFHDIDLPYEYPSVYLTNASFRMLWTEAYLLQAFLACNTSFDVLLGMAYLMRDRPDSLREAFVHFDPETHRAVSGSFWIVRRLTRT
jgi:hypothetical protein